MKLAIHKRKIGKTNKLRREGNIPAILYQASEPGLPIQVKAEEIKTVLRTLKPGLLSTTVFELAESGGEHYKAIIKEIQYNVASYDVEHIDFALVSEDKPVTVNVPLQMTGVGDCAGVKQGGFIRQVIRTLKVSCLPKHIPQEFTVDVRDLGIGQSKKLADVEMPANVKPLAKLTEVAVVVGKKAGT
jgi:large subunit ribosomal protein L25